MSTVINDIPVYVVFRKVLVSSITHLELFPPMDPSSPCNWRYPTHAYDA